MNEEVPITYTVGVHLHSEPPEVVVRKHITFVSVVIANVTFYLKDVEDVINLSQNIERALAKAETIE